MPKRAATVWLPRPIILRQILAVGSHEAVRVTIIEIGPSVGQKPARTRSFHVVNADGFVQHGRAVGLADPQTDIVLRQRGGRVHEA